MHLGSDSFYIGRVEYMRCLSLPCVLPFQTLVLRNVSLSAALEAEVQRTKDYKNVIITQCIVVMYMARLEELFCIVAFYPFSVCFTHAQAWGLSIMMTVVLLSSPLLHQLSCCALQLNACIIINGPSTHSLQKWESASKHIIVPYFCIAETVLRLYFKKIVLFCYQNYLYFFNCFLEFVLLVCYVYK